MAREIIDFRGFVVNFCHLQRSLVEGYREAVESGLSHPIIVDGWIVKVHGFGVCFHKNVGSRTVEVDVESHLDDVMMFSDRRIKFYVDSLKNKESVYDSEEGPRHRPSQSIIREDLDRLCETGVISEVEGMCFGVEKFYRYLLVDLDGVDV